MIAEDREEWKVICGYASDIGDADETEAPASRTSDAAEDLRTGGGVR